jgi:RNA polymerase sigma-70 factor (ECF subfamily)
MQTVSLSTESVWDQLHANIRGFVSRRVRQPADVDDIVQRVFLQVHRALPSLRDAEKLQPWIYQTTRRAIADYYRAPVRRREVAVGAETDLASVEEAGDWPPDEDGESALRELGGCLRPLIGSLGPSDAQALQLVEFDGLTQVEAAGRLGLSVSGMKSRVQRARVHLRSALEDCCRVALDSRGGVLKYEARANQCGSGSACGCTVTPGRVDPQSDLA